MEHNENNGVGRNHNFLSDCAERIRERYAKVQGATRETLEDLRDVGDTLNSAKEALTDAGRGAFGKWCEEAGLPFDKAWRARLMKLAAHWAEIIAAVEALPEGQRKWSVDGVLAAWKATQKKEARDGDEPSEDEAAGDGEAKSERKKRETEAEKLRRQLAEALETVAKLKAENAALKKGSPSGASPKPFTLSEKDKSLAVKLWALHTDRAASEGERMTSKAKLEAIAKRYGTTLEALLKAAL